MKRRTVTGLILIACLLAVLALRFVSVYIFDAFLMGIIVCSIIEVVKAYRSGGRQTYLFAPIFYVVVSYITILQSIENSLGFWEVMLNLVLCFAITVLLTISIGLFMYKKSKQEMKDLVINENASIVEQNLKSDVFAYTMKKVVKTTQILLYPCLLLISLFAANHLGEMGVAVNFINTADLGFLAIMSICAITIFTDMFALFVGITVKGPKLCPKISPKKTISGAIGGFLGGSLAAVAIFYIFSAVPAYANAMAASFTVWHFIFLGSVGAIVSEIGDLAASLLKRKVGIKDYGTIFPGQGGFMDRLDSIMFNSTWVFLFFVIML